MLVVLTILLLLGLCGVSSATGALADGNPPIDDLAGRVRSLFDRSGSMLREGRLDAILAEADTLLAASLAQGDTIQLVALRAHRARQLLRSSQPREAETEARGAIEAAEAWGDSTVLLEPVFVMIQAIDDQGRPPRVEPWMHRLVELGRAVGDPVYEARGRVFLARRALRGGDVDTALADLHFARGALADEPHDLTGALLVLGLAHAQRGAWDPAREAWNECARLSREIEQPFMEAGAMTNLANLDAATGDPAAAAAALRTAHAIYLREGRARAAVVPGLGSAANLARLGDFEAAITMLDEMLDLVREQGLLDLEPSVLQVRGGVLARQGSVGRARRDLGVGLDRALALQDPERAGAIASRLLPLLAERDSTQFALALLDRELMPQAPRMRAPTRLRLECEHARLLSAAGRHAEASSLAIAVARRSEELDLRDQRVLALQTAAASELARGDLTAARAAVEAAIEQWEGLRQITADPQWRETMGESGPLLAQTVARVHLHPAIAGPDAAEELWEVLQRLRTRTLLERMRGPSAPDSEATPRVELARLRKEVLGPDGVLLETHWGPRDVTIFWIDAQRCEIRRVEEDAPFLQRRLQRLQELIEAPHDGTAGVVEDAARAIGAELFGDWSLRLATAERVFYSPEGPLFAVALDLLVPECAVLPLHVPSAALLLAEPAHASSASGLRVLVGTRDEEGNALVSARREVKWLTARFGARAHVPGEHRVAPATLLHVAAHTRIDDHAPWRSAILVDRADRDPTWWTASEIASGSQVARVAVLASCASATGRALGGEGVLGIAHAFLSTGTSALVATAWPVDDATATRFTQAFYRSLSAGATVTAATEAARRRLRADPATSHPLHWAAWLVLGREDPVVELPARPRLLSWALGGAALLLLTWACAPRMRWRRG